MLWHGAVLWLRPELGPLLWPPVTRDQRKRPRNFLDVRCDRRLRPDQCDESVLAWLLSDAKNDRLRARDHLLKPVAPKRPLIAQDLIRSRDGNGAVSRAKAEFYA